MAVVLVILVAGSFFGGAQADDHVALRMLTINTPPIAYYEHGELVGFGVETVQMLAQRLGQPVTIEMGAFADNLKRSRLNPSLVLFPTARTSAWEGEFKWVGPIIPERICLYANKDSGISLVSLEAAKHVRGIATVQGYASEAFLLEHGFSNIVSHRSPSLCADALKYGRVELWANSDVTMASLARQAEVDPKSLHKVLTVSEFPSYLAFSPSVPDTLLDAWQRELDGMKADGTLESLRTKWLPRFEHGVGPMLSVGQMVEYTQEERAWLSRRHVVKVGVHPDLEPLDFVDAQGFHSGYSADILQLLSERTGLVFEVQQGLAWSQVKDGAASRSLDLVTCLTPSAEWNPSLLFTEPYVRFPTVLVTRIDAPFLGGVGDLSGKTVAAVRGFPGLQRFQTEYSTVRLLLVGTVPEALDAVSQGRAFACVGNLGAMGYQIRKRGLGTLKVASHIEFEAYKFAMGVRSDWPMLRTILNKALATITEDVHAQAMARWVAPPESPPGIESALLPWLWAGGSALLVVLLTMVFWNRRLRLEVADRARAEQNLAHSEQRFRELFDNAQVGIFEARLDDGRRLLSGNQRLVEMLGYDSESELLEDGALFGQLLDPALEDELCQAMSAVHGFLRLRTGLRHPDGSVAWAELSGRINPASGLVTGIVQDQTEQVLAQQALEESESLTRTMLDAIPFFVCLFGPDRRFRMVNRAGCDLLGMEFERLMDRHIGDVVPEDVWTLFKPTEDKALGGEASIVDMDTDYARRQGRFTAFYSPHVDAFGLVQGVACCIIDVSDRYRAEEELKSSEERYRVVVEQSKDAIVIGSMKGELMYGNPASEELFGYRLHEVKGASVERFFHAEDWPRIASFIGTAGSFNYEVRMIARDGSLLFVENSRSVIHYDGQPCILVQIRDMTERHYGEQRLRKNEERLQMALDSTEYGLWELWPQSGKLELPPKVFQDSFGYPAADLPMDLKTWTELVHPDDLQAAKEILLRYLRGDELSLKHEFRIRDADGQWRWILVQGRIVEHDEQGKALRSLGVVQDITERKKSEERLRELATTDSLTGLVNRRCFLEEAEREFRRAKRYGAALSLLMLDVDHFKEVNDTYGHEVGDHVLQSLAQTGLKVLRNVDIMGRMGGEEFAVLLPETGIDEAQGAAERLRASVEQTPVKVRGSVEVSCTVSIGVAQALEDETLDDLLRRADAAMYLAKDKGRNRSKVDRTGTGS